MTLPAAAEVVVVGGGTAGAAVAARLVEAGRAVLVLEAGPDPGPLGDPRWPADLVDATRLGTSFDWGFDSGTTYPEAVLPFERARVLGGCSTHNGAVQTWGHRSDYDGWAAAAGPDWSADALRPLFARASETLRVRTYDAAALTPFQAAWHAAAPALGLPQLADLNDLDETVGFAPESVNVVDGVRFNSAFAYLDPLRAAPGLTIAGDVLVDRLVLERERVTGVAVVHAGVRSVVRTTQVVLCAGTFGSPAILLRSGVGPAAALRALGVEPVVDLPGVGENLHDQPFVLLSWTGSPALERAMADAAARGWTPDEQVMGKAASRFDPDGFDLHLMPYSPTRADGTKGWYAGAGCLLPLSRGTVRLRPGGARDPGLLPLVDHRFYSDPDGHDLDVLVDGVGLLRELAAQPGLRDLLGAETTPGPAGADTPEAIHAYLRAHVDSYWHPVGTCAMGPATDPAAVADGRGNVHGVAGCAVADCALMPVVPRATTAMPATVIGERVAAFLVADGAG